MTMFALGINHKTAPVAIREKISFPLEMLNDALKSAHKALDCNEVVILSTCNRTELYISAENMALDVIENNLLTWLETYHQTSADLIKPYLYKYQDKEAISHAMRVACGLDSLVLGEPQILGQMKQAYSHAKSQNTLSLTLDRLFQRTFSVTKQVRTDTEIGGNAVSVAFAAVNLAKRIFSSLNDAQVLLIGAGETIELVSKYLLQNGVTNMTVANRTVNRAKVLADTINADVITLEEIPEYMHNADIVISSTGSPLPIIGKGMVESALIKRKHKPIFIVDLAVPRDIESQVAELEDAFLYTVDDLQEIISENMENRRKAAIEAEKLVNLQTNDFLGWLNGLNVKDSLLTYRQQSMAQKDELVEKAMLQLQANKDPGKIILELANKLANKLIHAPTVAIQTAAQQGDADKVCYLQEALHLNK